MTIAIQNFSPAQAFLGTLRTDAGAREVADARSERDPSRNSTSSQSIQDSFELSGEAEAVLNAAETAAVENANNENPTALDSTNRSPAEVAESESIEETQETDPKESPEEDLAFGELTEAEQRQVEDLQARDREVRAHEQAHLVVAGPYARGGPTYTFQAGPDGQRYAVGGEVSIDTAPIPGDPAATIRKAQTVRRAALAPAEPSAQDRRVAAAATQLEIQARQELREQEGNPEGEEENSVEAAVGILIDLVG